MALTLMVFLSWRVVAEESRPGDEGAVSDSSTVASEAGRIGSEDRKAAAEGAARLAEEGKKLLVVSGSGSPDEATQKKALECFRQARDLCPENPEHWRVFLENLPRGEEERTHWFLEGRNLLAKHGESLPGRNPAEWRSILEYLEQVFNEFSSPLHGYETRVILARDKTLASESLKLLERMQESLRLNKKEYLRMISEALALGEVDHAQTVFRQFKLLFPPEPVFDRIDRRIQVVRKVQGMLVEASTAMGARNWSKARAICQEIQAMDGKNVHARQYLETIEEAIRAQDSKKTIQDPMLARRKQLLTELSEAEIWSEFEKMRKTLRELKHWSLASPELLRRLEEVETLLVRNRGRIEENWYEAEKLFSRQAWRELKHWLNQNPAFAESPVKVIPLAEMVLITNTFLGLKNRSTLLDDATRIEAMNPRSFLTRFVKLKMEWDEGNYQAARACYRQAFEADPAHFLLTPFHRWFWVLDHGPQIIMPLLLLFFYLTAKFIPLIFSFLDAIYWIFIPVVIFIFPRLALFSLERRFGRRYDSETRIRHLESLVKASQRFGDQVKGEKYSQALLEIQPKNPLAISTLLQLFAAKPQLNQGDFEQVLQFFPREPKNRSLLEKIGKTAPKFPHISQRYEDVLEKYLLAFPQDAKVAALLGRTVTPLEDSIEEPPIQSGLPLKSSGPKGTAPISSPPKSEEESLPRQISPPTKSPATGKDLNGEFPPETPVRKEPRDSVKPANGSEILTAQAIENVTENLSRPNGDYGVISDAGHSKIIDLFSELEGGLPENKGEILFSRQKSGKIPSAMFADL